MKDSLIDSIQWVLCKFLSDYCESSARKRNFKEGLWLRGLRITTNTDALAWKIYSTAPDWKVANKFQIDTPFQAIRYIFWGSGPSHI